MPAIVDSMASSLFGSFVYWESTETSKSVQLTDKAARLAANMVFMLSFIILVI